MSTLPERLKALRLKSGMSQEEVAIKAGISQQAYQKLEAGYSRTTKHVIILSKIFKVTPEYLQYGTKVENALTAASVTDLHFVKRISWTDVYPLYEKWRTYMQDKNSVFLDEEESSRSSIRTLVVETDSMVSPASLGDSYKIGETLVYDMSLTADSGDIVIVHKNGEKASICRQLVAEGDNKYLKPLNPQYPTFELDKTWTICGVVFSVTRNIKKIPAPQFPSI